MIAVFSILRALALLRRTTRALESIARSQAQIAELTLHPPRTAPRKPKPTEFGVLDIDEVNKRWREQREVEGIVEDDS